MTTDPTPLTDKTIVRYRFDPASIPPGELIERAARVRGSWLKSLAERTVALCGIIAIAPLLALIAIAIKLDSAGPVIYRQSRYGIDGREFSIFKFRTMTQAASSEDFRQAERGDARITKFGALLRRINLDELPQLFNVLFGDMALIGPRPHPIALDQQFAAIIPGFMQRYAVRPGITGWAQVNGHRGETKTTEQMEARFRHDIEYIQNWSLRLDLTIAFRTLFHTRAYENAF